MNNTNVLNELVKLRDKAIEADKQGIKLEMSNTEFDLVQNAIIDAKNAGIKFDTRTIQVIQSLGFNHE